MKKTYTTPAVALRGSLVDDTRSSIVLAPPFEADLVHRTF
jgi:hypothetical protein